MSPPESPFDSARMAEPDSRPAAAAVPIPLAGAAEGAAPRPAPALPDLPALPEPPDLAALAATLALVGIAAGLATLGGDALPGPVMPLIFLTSVLVASVAYGFWSGLVAAALAFFVLNFLFTEPLFTLHISHAQDLITLLVFLFVAGLAGLLTGRLHDQAAAASSRAEVLGVLSALSADLGSAADAESVLASATGHLAALSGGGAAAFRADATGPVVVTTSPGTRPSDADLQAVERALRQSRSQPAPADGGPGAHLTILPLDVSAGDPGQTEASPGALALGHVPLFGPEAGLRTAAIDVLCRQTRAALQRLDFAARAQSERQRAEAEATRSALLASLSHDLRTPLATILGAATALKDLGPDLSAAAQADLLTAIEEEAARLNRHVTNLLQMTRLQAGLRPALAWVDAGDVARAAAARARRAWPQAVIEPAALQDLPMLRAEAGLLEQAVFNLIENALRHGKAPITLHAAQDGQALILTVADQGAGAPAPVRDWLASSDPRPPLGMNGLGLAVAKGIARVLGGDLTMTESPSTARLALPIPPDTQVPRSLPKASDA